MQGLVSKLLQMGDSPLYSAPYTLVPGIQGTVGEQMEQMEQLAAAVKAQEGQEAAAHGQHAGVIDDIASDMQENVEELDANFKQHVSLRKRFSSV